MSWTAADLANIETAIRDLVTGQKRKVMVTTGDRVESYERVDLPQLRALRDEMRLEVQAAAAAADPSALRRPRMVRVNTNKGL